MHLNVTVGLQEFGLNEVLLPDQERCEVLVIEALKPGWVRTAVSGGRRGKMRKWKNRKGHESNKKQSDDERRERKVMREWERMQEKRN